MVDLVLLQTFRVLNDQGTVTAAARALNLSPSAVSQQLRQLARQTGVDLLEPDGRRLRLTTAGRTLLTHADRLCTQWEQARAELSRHGAQTHRTLRLAGFATSVGPLLAPVAAQLGAATPPLRVTVEEADTRSCYEKFLADRVDIALVTPLPGSPSSDDARYHLEPLLDDVLDLVVPAQHALAAEESVDLSAAAHEDWIAPHHDQSRLMRAACALAGFSPRIVHQADEWQAVLALIGHGLGVCLVPRLVPVAAAAPVAGQPSLVRLPVRGTPPPARRIHTCVRRGSAEQDVIAAGLGALRACAGRDGVE
ncbi:LysR family transcriptional regulator [Streptomyces sp. NPDC059009]|uniref:LysR family transcriptional regulator n=1 Tax=Streptomyces sp. NPDC059009 TaxID=3346694 RepID=UPI0036CA7571